MQRRISILFAAATMATGLVVFTPAVRAEDDTKTTIEHKTTTDDRGVSASIKVDADRGADMLKFPAGFTTKDLGEDKDIRKELANATEEAVAHNHFDNLIGNFVDQDRNRMKEAKNSDVTALNEKIGEIRRDWKAKYGRDFDIDKETMVFNEQFAILQGEVADPNVAMANWPVPATMQMAAKPADERGTAVVAGAVQGDKGDINLERGRNVALVRVPASHGLPALTLSLIHELPDQWRIDLPNNITGEQLKSNLLTHLTHVASMKDKWPADENEAYRAVSHHIFMALYNVDMPSGSGDSSRDATGAGGTGTGASDTSSK